MDILVTGLEIRTATHLYTAHRNPSMRDTSWSVRRVHNDKPKIAPCMEVLTDTGWQHVLMVDDIKLIRRFADQDEVIAAVREAESV